MTLRLPGIFIGHGSPMNALADNDHTRAWRALAAGWPKPKAILSISAHWYGPGTWLTGEAAPRTIHDFGGFADALYRIRYPAAGAPALAARAAALLAPYEATLRTDWGLDHGTWSVLRHMYPQADVPVVQLSIDGRRAPAEHRAIGKLLAPLRDEGVLVLGSGGIVHNLGRVDWTNAAPVPAWAQAFDDWVQSRVAAGDDAALEDWNHGPSGRLAVPTPDHFLPLLYVLGTRASGEAARVVHTGYELGSISLTALQVG